MNAGVAVLRWCRIILFKLMFKDPFGDTCDDSKTVAVLIIGFKDISLSLKVGRLDSTNRSCKREACGSSTVWTELAPGIWSIHFKVVTTYADPANFSCCRRWSCGFTLSQTWP
eukprot:7899145-Karenia_brevis.AAC.1